MLKFLVTISFYTVFELRIPALWLFIDLLFTICFINLVHDRFWPPTPDTLISSRHVYLTEIHFFLKAAQEKQPDCGWKKKEMSNYFSRQTVLLDVVQSFKESKERKCHLIRFKYKKGKRRCASFFFFYVLFLKAVNVSVYHKILYKHQCSINFWKILSRCFRLKPNFKQRNIFDNIYEKSVKSFNEKRVCF